MTPREIDWALTAYAARQRRSAERMDLLAWLTGRYVALGVNAPGKYPRRPNCVKTKPEAMTADEMKKRFVAMSMRETP